MKAFQLTENTWLLISDKTKARFGIVKHTNGNFFLINKPEDLFDSLEILANSNDEKLKIEERKEDIALKEIEGFPVKHVNISNIEKEENLVTYTKNKNSKIKYVAGYFGIKFSIWTRALCPKYDTIKNTESIGPFKDKIEFNLEMKKKMNDG